MTELLSEQKQRGIYEWWGFRFDSDGIFRLDDIFVLFLCF